MIFGANMECVYAGRQLDGSNKTIWLYYSTTGKERPKDGSICYDCWHLKDDPQNLPSGWYLVSDKDEGHCIHSIVRESCRGR